MKKSKKMGMWLLLATLIQLPLSEIFGAASKKKSPVTASVKKMEQKSLHKTPKNQSNVIKNKPNLHATLVDKGRACVYSTSLNGSATASGERFSQNALTAAHLKLPLGTNVRVTSLETGKSVMVRINDRGPFSKKYVLDMSQSAAQKIGLTLSKGTMNVKIEKITPNPQEGKAVFVSHRSRS
jgi:rare lipoprotein A